MTARPDILSAMRGLRRITVLTLLGAAVLSCGCTRRTLFAVSEYPDTQFESYDRVRNRFVPEFERDVFGNRRPALRARLMPED